MKEWVYYKRPLADGLFSLSKLLDIKSDVLYGGFFNTLNPSIFSFGFFLVFAEFSVFPKQLKSLVTETTREPFLNLSLRQRNIIKIIIFLIEKGGSVCDFFATHL